MKALKASLPDGTPVADKAFRTEDVGERITGFLGRERLEPGEGLLITPCSAVHMLGMKLSLDIVFLDAAGKVLKVSRGLKPGRASFAPLPRWFVPWRNQVLELPEGAAHAIEAGMILTLEDR